MNEVRIIADQAKLLPKTSATVSASTTPGAARPTAFDLQPATGFECAWELTH